VVPTPPLPPFHPTVREWFSTAFAAATPAQIQGWSGIGDGASTLLLAPTGSGKTLAAFLWCLNRLMFDPAPPPRERCRVVYVSPLKALAVDVERNLRTPITGIAEAASRRGDPFLVPEILVRTGDTPASQRARFQRVPADIVITTPESLYLMLTSNARDVLRSVDTLIVDEIHALVPTKRGAHLALSIERLEALVKRPLQRIGLSATQRPLDEVARFLGGHRPVTVVDAGARKPLALRIEVPVEDMAKLGVPDDARRRTAPAEPARESIWTAIHPRLLDLVRQHRSTLIFVNNRRSAERLSAALNELAGEPLVRAHHGSLARTQRLEIEDSLKAGLLRGLVATSSLELGIDMGAIDLVVQIEAPPSVASGLQRIGRAGHQVGATSSGIIFPKYRGDLIACAAAAHCMHEGLVEATRFPRNPVDVLAQQIVAMAAMDVWHVDELVATIRRAAPFAELDRGVFEGVLDMLAGRYPSDEFAELRPRLTWDRHQHTVVAREGAKRVAIANGGTIPDRGLYGVFLAGGARGGARVGELDEEMVFESRVGETFLLGASTWRIEEITHDRVIVSAAPGEPGKMPFWRGEAVGRPLEFGRSIGALIRTLVEQSTPAALDRLERDHSLDRQAAENLLQYLGDQRRATGQVPDDRTVVIERTRDELGDWRICLLTPFGGQILAPWAMAIVAKIREDLGLEAETLWTDEGLVVRLPETERPPDAALLLPDPDDVERLVLRQLGSTSLFAAKFREAAARALLLPRRRIGTRTPLWQQRKRAADLLAIAGRFGSFPIVLETYRECLRDVFDMPALVSTLREVRSRQLRVVTVDSSSPSPFAASLLFGYVANYIYEGDAPLAERRAQALSIDHAQLQALIGDAELRELLDADAIAAVEEQVQQRDPGRRVRSADGLHDLLLRLGDLTDAEIAARAEPETAARLVAALVDQRRAVALTIAGSQRYVAVEDVGRYRDALGTPLPPGLPEALLAPVGDPLGDLLMRFARTHGPFTSAEIASRFALGRSVVEPALRRLVGAGRLLEGDFRPHGTEREWCEGGVLAQIRRRSLAKLRREVEPVDSAVLGRLVTRWQGVSRKRRGLDALLDVVETLQGTPLPASRVESEILPARIDAYTPSDLDALLAAGEIVWCGLEPLGERDGRIALYLTDHFARLWRPRSFPSAHPSPRTRGEGDPGAATETSATADARFGERFEREGRFPLPARGERAGVRGDAAGGLTSVDLDQREEAILAFLREQGASFFGALHQNVGGGFPGETVEALWTLVWRGLITNDAWHALRAYMRGNGQDRDRRARAKLRGTAGRPFRSRRLVPPAAEGRWSLIDARLGDTTTPTEWSAAIAQQLLARYGVITREVAGAESLPGGFSAIYDVLKALEESGRIRRGYFVSGVGATQFALPAALDLLRSLRERQDEPETLLVAATDPANPYGTLLKWPDSSTSSIGSDPTVGGKRPAPPPNGPGGDTEGENGSQDQADLPMRTLGRGPSRTVGAQVILVDGALAAYLGRGRQLLVYLPEAEPDRSRVAHAVASQLADIARSGEGREGGLLIGEIDGMPASEHPLAPALLAVGFTRSALGFQIRRDRTSTPPAPERASEIEPSAWSG
jgi:ATP-dependent Lhr-like helicase